jgi:hypothetical protein
MATWRTGHPRNVGPTRYPNEDDAATLAGQHGTVRDWVTTISTDGLVPLGWIAQSFVTPGPGGSSLTFGDITIAGGNITVAAGRTYQVTVCYGSDVLPAVVLETTFNGVGVGASRGNMSVTTRFSNTTGLPGILSYRVTNVGGADYNIIGVTVCSF